MKVRRRYAALDTGGITVEEECGDMRRTNLIDDFRADLRYACRALARTPGFAVVIGLFAALAITLAAVGIYGVISYSVNQRIPEFGVRIALGAQPGRVLKPVLSQSLSITIVGVAAGALCSLALARILRTLLYEVSAVDPLTYVGISAPVVVAILASYLPARRATHETRR